MENEGRGRAKQGGGLWKMEYIGYYIGIGQSFCRCYLFLFSFSLFALSSGFAEMDLGQTGAYPWNGESGAVTEEVAAVL